MSHSFTDIVGALTAIDDTDLDVLGAHYLGHLDARLKNLIQTGINSQGKPIKYPVDAVQYVPGDPALLVTVQSTTTNISDLKKKWILGKKGKRSEPSDIEKARKEFVAWEGSLPQGRRTLYLVTNRRVSAELAKEAVQYAAQFDIDVHVIDGSVLARYLEKDRDGHFLRRHFLGLDAEQLSEGLLYEVGIQSLSQHERAYPLAGGWDKSYDIQRDMEGRAVDILARSAEPVLLVRGPSGVGKSTFLRRVGRALLEKKSAVLWLPAETLLPQRSLPDVLTAALRSYVPTLDSRCGPDLLSTAAERREAVVLLIDDPNRVASPRQVLASVRAMCSAAQELVTQQGIEHPILRFAVPLWPSSGATAVEEELPHEAVDIGPFTETERSRLISKFGVGVADHAEALIEVLGGDPYLCGLAIGQANLSSTGSYLATIRALYERTVLIACEVTAERADTSTAEDVQSVLDLLIDHMIQFNDPEPTWRVLRQQLDEWQIGLLKGLADTRRLGWLVGNSGVQRWHWAHSRLRDALIGRQLATKVLATIRSGDEDPTEGWRYNAGLAEAQAMALAFSPSLPSRSDVIQRLSDDQPAALAEAIRVRIVDQDDAAASSIVACLRHALSDLTVENINARTVSEPTWLLLEKLAGAENPLALQVVQDLPEIPGILFIRLKAGDADAALKWLTWQLRVGLFPPAHPDLSLESVYQTLLSSGTWRQGVLIDALSQPPPGSPLESRLVLAGYLTWPELVAPLLKEWELLADDERKSSFAALIWMIVRCGTSEHSGALHDVLGYLFELGGEQRLHRLFMDPLQDTFRQRPMAPWAIDSLCSFVEQHFDSRFVSAALCYVLRRIDDPRTMELYVRWSAAQGGPRWDEGCRSGDPLASTDAPGGRRRGLGFDHTVPHLPQARNALWRVVESDSEESIRSMAYLLWSRDIKLGDLKLLQQLQPNDTLFGSALRDRVRLKDATAAEALVSRMREEPSQWVALAPSMYRVPEVAETMFEMLDEAVKEWINPANLVPQYLPHNGVEALLDQKKELLLRRPGTWVSVWRSDLPRALAFVREAIKAAPPIKLHLLFMGPNSFPFPVTQSMLYAIEPVIARLPQQELDDLADLAVGNGYHAWAREHLAGLVTPFKSELLVLYDEQIVRILNARVWAIEHGDNAVRPRRSTLHIRHLDSYPDVDHLFNVVRSWLGSSPASGRLRAVAEIVSRRGRGEDLSWWVGLRPQNTSAAVHWEMTCSVLQRRLWQT